MRHEFFVVTLSSLALWASVTRSEECFCSLSKSRATELLGNIQANMGQAMEHIRLLQQHLLNLPDDKDNLQPTPSTLNQSDLEGLSSLIKITGDKILNKTSTLELRLENSLRAQGSVIKTGNEELKLHLITIKKSQWISTNLYTKQTTKNNEVLQKIQKNDLEMAQTQELVKQGVTDIKNTIKDLPKKDLLLLAYNRNVQDLILKQVNNTLWQMDFNHHALWDGITDLKTLINRSEIKVTKLAKGHITKVNTTEELHQALTDSVKNSVIELSGGIFDGRFTLLEDSVTIIGRGLETVIKLTAPGTKAKNKVLFNIIGKNCEVRDLKLVSTSKEYTTGIQLTGSESRVTDVQIEGFRNAILTTSDGHKFSKVSVKNSNVGLNISSNRNILSDIKLQSMSSLLNEYAILLKGDYNSVNSISCEYCNWGILLLGNYNRVQHMEMRYTLSPRSYWGLRIHNGIGNFVAFFRSDGDELGISSSTSNSEIRNVLSARVSVGGTDQTLSEVDGGRVIEVHGSDVRLQRCKAVSLEDLGTNLTLIQSTFDSVE